MRRTKATFRLATGGTILRQDVASAGSSRDRVGPWIFSDMEPRDLPGILAIERESFHRPWSATLFLQELQLSFSRIVLARRLGAKPAVLGYLCRWFVADEIHILNVAVHPEHRRCGVGAALMMEALREARDLGAVAATLEVRRGNAGARRLYESLRFEEVGVRRNYYGRGEDALILRRVLASDG